jgi:hypothetical protein
MASFRWMQSSLNFLWHLWNRHYLVLSTPLLFLRRSLWWFGAGFLRIGYRDLGEDLLPRQGQGCVHGEATGRSLAFTTYFSFLLFLVEGIFGGFSSRLLLSGFVKAMKSLRVFGRSRRTTFLIYVPLRRPLAIRYCYIVSSAPRTSTTFLLNLSM